MQCKMKSLDVRKLLRQRLQSGLQKNGLIDMFSFMAEIKDEYIDYNAMTLFSNRHLLALVMRGHPKIPFQLPRAFQILTCTQVSAGTHKNQRVPEIPPPNC